MADLRITPGPQSLATVQPAARTEAVKAAQRAFFNNALAQAQAQTEVKRTVSAPAVEQPTVTRLHASPVEGPQQTDRMLRPGSLLDIKV